MVIQCHDESIIMNTQQPTHQQEFTNPYIRTHDSLAYNGPIVQKQCYDAIILLIVTKHQIHRLQQTVVVCNGGGCNNSVSRFNKNSGYANK